MSAGQGRQLRLTVDQAKCESVGICVRECPQVFRFRWGNKRATVISDPIPPDLRDQCLDIVKRCPKNAIVIIDA